MAATNRTEKDIFAHDVTVGSVVMVKCTIISISPAPTAPVGNVQYGGSGDLVTCQVEVKGNIGEVSPGPIFTISPVQLRYAGSSDQA